MTAATEKDLARLESGPLEPGITVLEASAGTGKTYQITNLVVRLVAEAGVTMGQILVVTFTNAATAELRDRIRERLALAARALRKGGSSDKFLDRFVGRAGEEREAWLRAVARAQEEFDQAHISTIHGFCQRMLQQHAFESGADFDLELLTDDGDLLEELVDDYLSAQINTAEPERYSFLVDACEMTRGELLDVARARVADPDMELDPLASEEPPPGWREVLTGVRGAWDAGALALGDRFDRGRPTDKNRAADLGAVIFEKAQTTYTTNAVKKKGPLFTGWIADCLDQGALLLPEGDLAGWMNRDKFNSKLAPGAALGEPLWERALGALDLAHALEDARQSNALSRPWREFAGWVRDAYSERLERQRALCFQDLLVRLARALKESPQLELAIRARFRAALIDEFQDTDHLQWDIFRRIFDAEDRRLYLIGDPKQAIYGFRGANVHVYTDARGDRDALTICTNFRSDARYVAAMNAVMGRWPDSLFGHPGIRYVQVGANPERLPVDRLVPPRGFGDGEDAWLDPRSAPLQLRFIGAEPDEGGDGVPGEMVRTQVAEAMPRRVAADVVAFLKEGFQIQRDPEHDPEPVTPGDLAVLVASNRNADNMVAALMEAGVPAVRSGAGSVFSSEEARHLLLWLKAVASPGDDRAARAAAVTPAFGWTARQLLNLDNPDEDNRAWDRWLGGLMSWQEMIQKKGLQQTFRRAMSDWGAHEKLLSLPDGERRITNVFHLLELGYAAQLGQRLRLDGLVSWLSESRQRVAEEEKEAAELRLERDDAAVKVLTMHKSKGLQYPVVFAPFLWDGSLVWARDENKLVHPVAEGVAQRRLALQREPFPPEHLEYLRLAEYEAQREKMRLLYVALTRAELRCFVYTGKVTSGDDNSGLERSPLGVLLHGQDPADEQEPGATRYEAAEARIRGQAPAALKADLEKWADVTGWSGDGAPAGEPPLVAVSDAPLPVQEAPRYHPVSGVEEQALEVRSWSRERPPGSIRAIEPGLRGLDHTWQRLSYTSITRTMRREEEPAVESRSGIEPVPEAVDRAQDHDGTVDLEDEPARDLGQAELAAARPPIPEEQAPVPLAEFPPGPDAGTFLHALYEHLDFQVFPREPGDAEEMARGRKELRSLLEEQGTLHGITEPRHLKLLREHLPATLQTPLGGELGDLRLADIPGNRRLDELAFDLPVAGGDEHRRRSPDGSVMWPARVSGAAFGQAFLGAVEQGDLRPEYLEQVSRGWVNHRFAGFLTGTIDLVFATPLEGTPERFYVLDYKSNKLDLLGEGKPRPQNFCRAWMMHEMEHHAYLVQAYLYTVALQRFLRHRLGEDVYDYDRHVGGALYLFMRGMTGPDTGTERGNTLGVFHHRPPGEVIDELDRLLGGEEAGGDA